MRTGHAQLIQGSYVLIAAVLVWCLAAPALPASAQEPAPWTTTLRVQTPVYTVDAMGVTAPDTSPDATPGAPALPVWSTTVELPATGAYRISYQSPGAGLLVQQVDVAAASVPDAGAASLQRWDDLATQPAVAPTVDRPDPAIYGANAFYPATPVVAGQEQWQRGRRLLALRVFPFQYNPATRTLRYHPDVQIEISVSPGAEGANVPDSAPANPAASTPGALRIRTGERGLYRLTYDDLAAAGVPLASLDPTTLAMSYLGQAVAVQVIGEGDGSFDPGDLVVFYALPYTGRYQRDNVYWLTYGAAPGLRMASRAVTPTGSEPLITTITQTLHVEFDREYRSDYPRPQDADHWFDTPLSPAIPTGVLTVTRSYDLALDDALTTGVVQIEATLQGATDRAQSPDQSVALRLNDHPLGRHQWEGLTYTTVLTTTSAADLDSSPNRLHLVAAISQLPGIDLYSFSPDWVQVSYPALADAEGDRIIVEGVAAGANQVQVSGWSTPDVRVYDLRNPNQPVQLLTTVAEPAGGSYSVSFWDADLPGPTYALSTLAALAAPLAVEADAPSTWGTPTHQADYIAVVHASLWEAIDPLLAHRAAEGLRIAKVDVQDIYDEWNYGRRDPEAIRSFLSYAYHYWNPLTPHSPLPSPQPPQYVLLVGDGHTDFKGVSNTTLPNLLPPYLAPVDPWRGEVPVDNRYVSVDGPDDFLPDMAVGRIPANTPADVAVAVDKIIAYEAAPDGPWQERVVFAADSNIDWAGDFHAFSDSTRLGWLPAGYDDRTIYFNRDYLTGSAMNTAMRQAFNDDALLVQWFGHGNIVRWGSVQMFTIFDPPALQANDRWPFVTVYTCLTGSFVYLGTYPQSLAEVLLQTPQRGAVAVLAPSGYHIGSTLAALNQRVTQAVFQQRIARAGQAVTAAKVAFFGAPGSAVELIDTYIYFGDPALKLRLPAPQLANSTVEASRAWAPPGQPITFTATLSSTAALSTTAQLTLTLPAALGAPSALSATSSSAVYDPASHRITWSGVVTTGAAEMVTFSSALVPGTGACSEAAVGGQTRDGLAALTALHVAVQAATPDVDCDGGVDIADIQQVTARWGAAQGDPGYNPRYDLDGDDVIGLPDVVIAAQAW